MSYNRNILFLIIIAVTSSEASNGDRNQFFINCRRHCDVENCTADSMGFSPDSELQNEQGIFDKVFRWSCGEECQYSCMWRTVNAFIERGWQVPQFYGKWPFIRLFGLQEPASVLFSSMNFVAHLHQLKKFRKEVRADSPLFYLWQAFSFTCLNGWVWSTVFHARESNVTEKLDYAFAYSIVLISGYCMLMRVLHNRFLILRAIISILVMSFFINYFAYVTMGNFDYSFNMKTNIVTGVIGGVGWILWFAFVRKRRSYAWKILLFNILLVITIGLEIRDFPPIYWIFDAHSLWHLSTVPLVFLFYSFIIDDCKSLRKEEIDMERKHD